MVKKLWSYQVQVDTWNCNHWGRIDQRFDDLKNILSHLSTLLALFFPFRFKLVLCMQIVRLYHLSRNKICILSPLRLSLEIQYITNFEKGA